MVEDFLKDLENEWSWIIINGSLYRYTFMMLGYIHQLELRSASDILFTIMYRTFDKKYLYFPHPSIPDRLPWH